jgi:hypothetical protein
MFASHRPRLAGLISAFAIASGAAGLSGVLQASADSLPAFACADSAGGASGAAATVTDVRVAHHDGYDRLVIDFTGNAVPQYDVHRQASSTFIRDASGQSVTLEGSAGIRLVLRNSDVAGSVPSDQKPRLPEIREVANIGNFERVVSYGVGLRDQACIRVFQLTGPSRLVIDVATPPDAPAAAPAAASSNPTAQSPASASASAPAAATDSSLPSDLATTGHPAAAAQPSAPIYLPLAVGLLLVIAGLAIFGLHRFARR